jgi:phosphoribosylamine-glycine ligase
MKKIFVLAAALIFVTALGFAQTMDSSQQAMEPGQEMVSGEVMTLKGDIIDNKCAGMQSPEGLGDFVKTHTKMCALMPECIASGYSIYSDGKLMKFDKDSNGKIEEFLKKEDSKLQVVVEAKKTGDELSLVSIQNQE